MKRGEVWWAHYPHRGQRHPVVLLSWDADQNWRNQITVAPISTTIRGIDAEVRLDQTDGLRDVSVANLDAIATIRRSELLERVTLLPEERMWEIERAIHVALGIRLPCPFSLGRIDHMDLDR